MYKIPHQAEIRQRMLDAVRASVEMLKGVAGFSVVRTERPGSAIGAHGGIQEDMQLDKVLIRMRDQADPTRAEDLIARAYFARRAASSQPGEEPDDHRGHR
jgi:hypothetical protein